MSYSISLQLQLYILCSVAYSEGIVHPGIKYIFALPPPTTIDKLLTCHVKKSTQMRMKLKQNIWCC